MSRPSVELFVHCYFPYCEEVLGELKNLGGIWSRGVWLVPPDRIDQARDVLFNAFGDDGNRFDQVSVQVTVKSMGRLVQRGDRLVLGGISLTYLSAKGRICRSKIVVTPAGGFHLHKHRDGDVHQFLAPAEEPGIIVMNQFSRARADACRVKILQERLVRDGFEDVMDVVVKAVEKPE